MIPIADLHTDLVLAHFDFGDKILQKSLRRQITIDKLIRSDTKVIFAGFGYDNHYGDSRRQLNTYKKILDNKNFNVVLSKKDLKSHLKKINIVLHIEGGGFIRKEEDFLECYANGVRSISLTHNYKNSLACGVGEDDGSGLTLSGKKIVRLANKLGVILDLAHLNEQGFLEAASRYSGPLIVSHTACRKICDLPRNISDDQLKLVAKSDGIVGIFFSKKFISKNIQVGVEDLIKHFKRIAQLIGVRHLAIGSDFGGITTGKPKSLTDINKLKNLLFALRKSGFSSNEIDHIAYKNALRVLKKILP